MQTTWQNVKVGVPAVSRYHPVLEDHDFLTPGYLLSVSGYMFLENDKAVNSITDHSLDDPTENTLLQSLEILKNNGLYVKAQASSLKELLAHQVNQEMETECEGDELFDLIVFEIESNGEIYFQNNIESLNNFIAKIINSENPELEEITTVLSALATVLSCKIYIITLNNENITEIASKEYSRGSIHLIHTCQGKQC